MSWKGIVKSSLQVQFLLGPVIQTLSNFWGVVTKNLMGLFGSSQRTYNKYVKVYLRVSIE